MGSAFFEPLGGGRYHSTGHTVGPWSPDSQHLGPSSALLTRELELLAADAPMDIARITVEILGPVPVTELAVSAEVERPGRSVELLCAQIDAGGRTVVRGRAWRIARSDTRAVAAGAGAPLAPPEQAHPAPTPEGWGTGYLDALEWRSLHGGLGVPGAATVWGRQLVELVAGEAPSGLQRLMAVADSGNGVSNRLDPREWWFINTELTVHLHRAPAGEWIGLDAGTVIGANGVGTAQSVLHDRSGPVGTGVQALMVRPR